MLPSCPSETALLAFSRGELGPAGVDRLDAHVDQCEACRRTLALLMQRTSQQAPVASESPTTVASMTPRAKVRRPAAPRLAPGTRLADRDHVRRLLGRGGMGEVYEVEDELLNERIALKVLSEDLAADD